MTVSGRKRSRAEKVSTDFWKETHPLDKVQSGFWQGFGKETYYAVFVGTFSVGSVAYSVRVR